jgi:hypothetical protein
VPDAIRIAAEHGFQVHQWTPSPEEIDAAPGFPRYDPEGNARRNPVLVMDGRKPADLLTSPLTMLVLSSDAQRAIDERGVRVSWDSISQQERDQLAPADWDINSFTEVAACNVAIRACPELG